MTTIAVVGPGAIGGTLAVWLDSRAGNRVSICARTPFERLTVSSPGRQFDCHLPVHTEVKNGTVVDWVILATKTYQVATAAEWFVPLCDGNTRVAVTQNGVEHINNVAPYFDEERIVPVIIDCPAEHLGPGKILQRGPISMAVPDNENSRDFAALFDDPGITIDLTDSWVSAAWKKLCINSAGAVSALVNQPVVIANDVDASILMTALIHECIAVGRAEGAHIDDAIVEQILANDRAAQKNGVNSIHADLMAGRPMEWDARNGVVARLGEKHGIATPYNQMAALLLSVIEKSFIK